MAPKIVPISLEEALKFERGGVPLETMGIGKYEGFRNHYNKKPFLEVLINIYKKKIDTPGPDEANYRVYLFYEKDWYETNNPDSVYFFNEKLFEGWDDDLNSISMAIMNNKPIKFFEYGDEERTMWRDDQVNLFNKNIIDPFFEKRYNELINNLSEEWFEQTIFVDMLADWIDSGNYKTHLAKINPL
jgi:hypothetical protein